MTDAAAAPKHRLARPSHRRARAPHPRRPADRGQHPLDLRQARGARPGAVQGDVAGADRKPADPAAGCRNVMVDALYNERRRLQRAAEQAAGEPAGPRRPDCRHLARARRPAAQRAPRPPRVQTRSSSSPPPRRSSSWPSCTATRRCSKRRTERRPRPAPARAQARRPLRVRRNLAAKVPQGSAQVTILKADNLKTAQNVTHWLEQIANFVWILALACWFGAIWLARGRRRQEVRSLGIGLMVVGVLVLVARYLAGKYFVDQLVVSDTVRPAASDAWDILTDSLAAAGWVALIGRRPRRPGAWLVGPGEHPTRHAPAGSGHEPLGGRLGRVRGRDGVDRLGAPDPGLPDDRRSSSSSARSASRLPTPGARPRRRVPNRRPSGRAARRIPSSAQSRGSRQSLQLPCSTISCACIP